MSGPQLYVRGTRVRCATGDTGSVRARIHYPAKLFVLIDGWPRRYRDENGQVLVGGAWFTPDELEVVQ